jgi:hypothetical protein
MRLDDRAADGEAHAYAACLVVKNGSISDLDTDGVVTIKNGAESYQCCAV